MNSYKGIKQYGYTVFENIYNYIQTIITLEVALQLIGTLVQSESIWIVVTKV